MQQSVFDAEVVKIFLQSSQGQATYNNLQPRVTLLKWQSNFVITGQWLA